MEFIPYGRHFLDSQDIQEVVNVLKTGFISQGPRIGELEKVLCRYTGARFAVAVSSGTAALHIASIAAGIGEGDRVITSALTFVASGNCVLYCGARPVFADIDYQTQNISPENIEDCILRSKEKRRIKTIIPVHFSGLPCDMERIHKLAGKYGLTVIEDAAHALGARYRVKSSWVRVGSCRHSDMSIFSFHPVKSITTGEGGAVLTNRKDLYEKLLKLRNHGITRDNRKFVDKRMKRCGWYYEMQDLGFNYRMTDIQAALGISQLKKLNKFIKRREEIAAIYTRAFKNLGQYLEISLMPSHARSAWHLYVVRLKDKNRRKEMFDYLRSKGVGVQVHYIPLYHHPYYRRLGYKSKDYPETERYYQRCLSLPLYYPLSHKNVKRVIGLVKDFFKAGYR